MLCQFSFQNFKSYKDETILDMQATSIAEFSESLISKDNGSNLLPVNVIYGPNGGGKSNLLQALACLISTVVDPIHDLDKSRKEVIIQDRVVAEPFLYDDKSNKEPVEFQIFFRVERYEYRYYLAILNDKISGEVLDRRMIGAKKPARIFEREKGEIDLGTLLKKEGVNTNINEKMPFLSFLAINYNIPEIAVVQEWFESCVIRKDAFGIPEMYMILFGKEEGFKEQFITLFNDMGIDIIDYRIDTKEKKMYLKRLVEGVEYELSIDHESDGTRKLIEILPMFLMALREGRLTIIDELDVKLHPKLLRYIISLFKNPHINKKGAQLLFTSHDMATMKNTVFRRDEILFASLDEKRSSQIYSLYEIRRENNERINSTAAFDKQYLEGRYGADPYLQNMMTGGDWS